MLEQAQSKKPAVYILPLTHFVRPMPMLEVQSAALNLILSSPAHGLPSLAMDQARVHHLAKAPPTVCSSVCTPVSSVCADTVGFS
jgi:hypothetical protein